MRVEAATGAQKSISINSAFNPYVASACSYQISQTLRSPPSLQLDGPQAIARQHAFVQAAQLGEDECAQGLTAGLGQLGGQGRI